MSKNKLKFNQDVKDRKIHFTMVPNRIFDLKLRPSEFLIYIYLLSQAESWTPGIRTIDQATGLNKSTVNASLKVLIQKGLINLISTKKGLRNHYEIVPWSAVYSKFKHHPNNFQRKKNAKKQTLCTDNPFGNGMKTGTPVSDYSRHIKKEQKEKEDKTREYNVENLTELKLRQNTNKPIKAKGSRNYE